MTKALFKLEQKNTLKLMLVFSILVGIFSFVIIALYPTLSDILNQLAKENAGTELEKLLQITNVGDYFTSNMLEIWGLFGAIFAICIAVKLTTQNFKDNSFEIVYGQNLSRKAVIKTKFLNLLLNICWFTLIVAVFSYIGLVSFIGVSKFSTLNFLVYVLIVWLITMQMGLIGFGLGMFFKRKFSTVVGVLLVLVFFIITTVSQLNVEWVGYLSPFTVLTASILDFGFNALADYVIGLVVWSILSSLITLFGFLKFKNEDFC